MTRDIALVLIVFIGFICLILSGKVKIHVAALLIPIFLEVTGVLSFAEAWGGLTNSSVVMMASMFVIGAAINKTSLLGRMSNVMIKPGASDFRIMLGIAIPVLFLGCFINATAIMVIMIPMITTICAEHRRPVSKFMYPAAALSQLWVGFLPTGGNVGRYLANNTIVEELGGTPTWTYFTEFISKIPIMIILIPTILCVTMRMAPDLGNIPATAAEGSANSRKSKISPLKEKITIAIFFLVVIGIVVCALTGISTWYAPLIGAFLLVIIGVLSDREAISSMGNPVIFITVGTLPLATALSKTGADTLIADLFNKLTGNASPLVIMVSMYLVCMVLTQFITNSAVSNSFKTLAALIAVQSGYDARALMLCTTEGAANAYLLPMASPAMTMGYEAGGYSIKQHFKMGIVLGIIHLVVFCIYIPLAFPLT